MSDRKPAGESKPEFNDADKVAELAQFDGGLSMEGWGERGFAAMVLRLFV